MNIAHATAAIRSRLLADTSPGGLRAASSPLLASDEKITTYILAPDQVGTIGGYPYVVIDVISVEEEDAFDADAVRYEIDLHVFDLQSASMTACADIIDRIRGDAMAQPTRQPSYGLHRHTITLPTPWTGGLVVRAGGRSEHDQAVQHYVESYIMHATRHHTP